MKQMLFCIHDSKAHFFAPPFTSENCNTALRLFKSAFDDPTTQIHKFPEDFSLHYLGEYDTSTSEITTETPQNLGLATRYISNN